MMGKKALLLLLLIFPGCASLREKIPFLGKKQVMTGGVYKENLDSDRIIDLVIVKKITSKKRLGMFTKYLPYLEGYIRGYVVDYDDTPIEGIVVRASDKGKDLPGFDPGVSDANGVYKIRFSLPIVKGRVDQQGGVSYNPPWQQQLDLLGVALEPQTKETKFRLFYDRKMGIVGIGEDIPKTITRRVSGSPKEREAKSEENKKVKLPEKKTPSGQSTSTPQKKEKEEDFFGGFGDFGR